MIIIPIIHSIKRKKTKIDINISEKYRNAIDY